MVMRSRTSTAWWMYRDPRASSRALRLHAVEAAGPKKLARRSLSMPTTSRPCRAKKRAASDPMRPADPVTMAIGMAASSSEVSLREDSRAPTEGLAEDVMVGEEQHVTPGPSDRTAAVREKRHVGAPIDAVYDDVPQIATTTHFPHEILQSVEGIRPCQGCCGVPELGHDDRGLKITHAEDHLEIAALCIDLDECQVLGDFLGTSETVKTPR